MVAELATQGRAAMRSRTADTWLAGTASVVAFAAWYVLVRIAPELPRPVAVQIPQVARALAAGLFLTSGVLWLVRWRLTDDPRSARAGTALILLGGALPV